MVVLVWDRIPTGPLGTEAPRVPVETCENTDVHDAHFYSGRQPVMVCHGVRHPLPTSYVLCQEIYPNVRDFLPCKFKESGGYQCENLEPHTDEHSFGSHTIRHSIAGNGWSCEDVDKSLPASP